MANAGLLQSKIGNLKSNENGKRRGRESNPRIAVLQTATLPLGYPAGYEDMLTILVCSASVNEPGV